MGDGPKEQVESHAMLQDSKKGADLLASDSCRSPFRKRVVCKHVVPFLK